VFLTHAVEDLKRMHTSAKAHCVKQSEKFCCVTIKKISSRVCYPKRKRMCRVMAWWIAAWCIGRKDVWVKEQQ